MEELITFWFANPARAWIKDPAFDAELRARFGDLQAAVARGEHEAWRDSPSGTLAYVLALDQLPRNLFRDSAAQFATDATALAAASTAVDRGFDRALPLVQRGFLYLPLMHSEVLADQRRSVALYADRGPPAQRDFAQRHHDIIERFGRFPHRNAVLSRASTAEELAFLQEPGSSF